MTQTIATVLVALIGIGGTLLAGLFAHRQERVAEQRQWARDQRFVVYADVMKAYLGAFLALSEQHATTRAMASLQSEVDASVAEIKAAGAPAADEASLALSAYDGRIAKLEDQIVVQEERSGERAARFQDQTAVLWLVGSETIQELAIDVRAELTQLLAATVDPETAGMTRLSDKWAMLQVAMRQDLHILD
jgi:hypothetical protein